MHLMLFSRCFPLLQVKVQRLKRLNFVVLESTAWRTQAWTPQLRALCWFTGPTTAHVSGPKLQEQSLISDYPLSQNAVYTV